MTVPRKIQDFHKLALYNGEFMTSRKFATLRPRF